MAKILVTPSTFNLKNFQHLAELQLMGIEIVTNPYGRRLTKDEILELIDS